VQHQLKDAGFNTCLIYCQENRDMKPSDLTVTVFLEGADKCYGRDQGVRGTFLLHQFSIDPEASLHTCSGDLLFFRAPATHFPIMTTIVVISDPSGIKATSRGQGRSLAAEVISGA